MKKKREKWAVLERTQQSKIIAVKINGMCFPSSSSCYIYLLSFCFRSISCLEVLPADMYLRTSASDATNTSISLRPRFGCQATQRASAELPRYHARAKASQRKQKEQAIALGKRRLRFVVEVGAGVQATCGSLSNVPPLNSQNSDYLTAQQGLNHSLASGSSRNSYAASIRLSNL